MSRRFCFISSLLTVILLSACVQEVDRRLLADRKTPTPNVVTDDSLSSKAVVQTREKDAYFVASEMADAVANQPAAKLLHRQNTQLWQQESLEFFPTQANTEQYANLIDGRIINVVEQPVSTFSIDVDTGAYSNVRRFLNSGTLPPEDAVRVEEMLNYFSYDYPVSDLRERPFSLTTEVASTPWNSNTRLLHIGLKGYEVAQDKLPASNLVFLIDVSGSMSDPNKLGLLKSAIQMMARNLDDKDSVSIVVYAGASGVVLEPTPGSEYKTISAALQNLQAGGSTNGHAGIEQAYAMAEKSYIDGGVNRVILATDGDFNVGVSDVDALKKLIASKRESGIALTTLGFGIGNYNDHLMEQLADTGNGSYAYIDTLNEARKVLSDELSATLLTIARDVKIQVEFNPSLVSEYRLIGYVNRHLANEDFSNDKVDAGEIGAGHSVTALYEVALQGEGGEWNTPSRYSRPAISDQLSDEIAEVRLRYKPKGQSNSVLFTEQISKSQVVDSLDSASNNFRFAASVAAFGEWLRGGKYQKSYTLSAIYQLGKQAQGNDPFGYRGEYLQLVRLAQSLDDSRALSDRSVDQIKLGG